MKKLLVALIAGAFALGSVAALAAEQDFGQELMAKKRGSLRHEALAAQLDANLKR